MAVLGSAIYWISTVYIWILIARFLIDLVIGVNPNWRPRGIVLVLSELVFTLTDPPLQFLRRFIKPLRLGMISLDFSWTVLLILASLIGDLGQTLI